MRLYIMRHGRAVEPEQWNGEERERPLTEEGRAEMRAAAPGLRWLDVQADTVISSPYRRTYETAEIVAAALKLAVALDDALMPGATLHGLAPLFLAHREASGLLLVGHEPDLSTLIATLIGAGDPASITMKKGACCRLELPDIAKVESARDVRRLAGHATLRWLLTAPQLAQLGAAGAPEIGVK